MPRAGIGALRWTGGGPGSRTGSASGAAGRGVDVPAPATAAWAIAGWAVRAIGAGSAGASRTGGVCARCGARASHALLPPAPQPLDQLRHLAHEAAEDVVAEKRDAERERETHLRLDVREAADSM